MKSLMHTLHELKEQNPNTRLGGWEGILFSRLMEHPARPAVKRVERVLSLLAAADEHLREWHRLLKSSTPAYEDDFLNLHRRTKESEFAYYNAVGQLNRALKRYRWRSVISGDIHGFKEEIEGEAKHDAWEWAIVRMLLDLTKQPGALSRFRRCSECHRWFYAATAHQQFCGEVCRRRHSSQSPEFKEKRRNYMRERYRPAQKEMQERSLHQTKVTRKGAN